MSGQERLTFLAFSVSELAASLHFYQDVVGVPLHVGQHDDDDVWMGGEHAAYSWTDGAYIHFALYPARLPIRPVTTGCQVGFHVDDFDAVFARVQARQIQVVQQPRVEPWGRTARFLDPDSNIVSITER